MFDAGGGLSGGILTYGGGTAPLVGTNVPVQVHGPAIDGGEPGVLTGLLTFATGNFQGQAGDSQTFGAGGTFEVHGDVSGASPIPSPQDPVIFSGQLGPAAAIFGGTPARPTFTFTSITPAVQVSSGATSLFPPQLQGIFSLALSHIAGELLDQGSGYSFEIIQTDFAAAGEAPPADPVPEARSLVLLGTGLALLAAMLRRRTAALSHASRV